MQAYVGVFEADAEDVDSEPDEIEESGKYI